MDIRQVNDDFLQPLLADIRAAHQHVEEHDAAVHRMSKLPGAAILQAESPMLTIMRRIAARAEQFEKFQKQLIEDVTAREEKENASPESEHLCA